MSTRSPRIHLLYTDSHFSPHRDVGAKVWTIYGQAATHMWAALHGHYGDSVSYGMEIPPEPIDLLVTQPGLQFPRNVRRYLHFAQTVHFLHIRSQLRDAVRATSQDQFRKQGLRGAKPLRRCWRHYRMLAGAQSILVSANETNFASYRRFSPFDADRCVRCHWGIERTRFRSRGPREESRVFVYAVNSFCLQKGAELMAGAWERFSATHPEAQLLVLGREGDYDFRARLSGRPNIEWVGAFEAGSDTYIGHLNRGKWIVVPSRFEAQAATLVESMSCGCIPICSRNSGIDAERYGGFPVEPNSADALVAAMEAAWKDASPARYETCQATLDREHAWTDFERILIEMTGAALSGPAVVRRPQSRLIGEFLETVLREKLLFVK